MDDLACRSASAEALEWCSGVESDDDEEDLLRQVLDSHLPYVVRRSRAIQSAVGGGVWPVAVLAALAGIGLVASTASLWAERQRRELTLLAVRGISPAVLGMRAALEAALALFVGGAAGIGLAYGAVKLLGPSPQIESAALARSVVGGAVTTLAGALAFGVVVGWRARSAGRHSRVWHRLRLVPWELGAVVCAVISYRRLGEWGVPVSQGPEVSRVDVLGLLFPLLFMVGAVGLVTRLLALVLGPLRHASRNWPVPVYLAIRRIARYRVAATALLASSAIAGGVFCYATTLDRTLDATLQAKASTSIGSDLVLRLRMREEVPQALAADATAVQVFRSAWIDDGGDRVDDVVVRAIDPATFADVAFWDGSFADRSLHDLMDQFAEPCTGPLPAIVVGDDVPGGGELHISGGSTARLQIETVPGVEAFPGMRRNGTTVYLAAPMLAADDPGGGVTEWWLRGARDEALSTLQSTGLEFFEGRSYSAVVDQTAFRTVAWTFAFMRSLGVAAGALVVAATVVYLDARRRDRVLGYAFARRMGLARRSHRRAILVELVMSVAVGCWLGLVVALVGAWLASDRIDPIPAFPPAPLFRPAVVVAVVVGALGLVVVGCGAVLAQRRADRDDPVEVMRAGV